MIKIISKFYTWAFLNPIKCGVFGATGLIGLLTTYVGVEFEHSIKAIYSLITFWNQTLDELGAFLGRLPFIPKLKSPFFNSMLVFINIVMPVFIRWSEIFITKPSDNRISKLLSTKVYRSLAIVAILFYLLLFHNLLSGEFPNKLELYGGVFSLIVFFILFIVLCLKDRTYRNGVIIVLVFCLTIQILYWSSQPDVKDWVLRIGSRIDTK